MSMTLKELSSRLGLSQTTVSRALNGYPEVSEDTRNRVIEAARNANYTPNPRARGLATGRAMSIGHVLPMLGQSDVVNPVFADFLAGAGAVYTRRGYAAHLTFADHAQEPDHYRWLMTQRIVDGVILHGPRENDDRMQLLQDIGMVFGVHGRAAADAGGYNFVEMDNRAAFEVLSEHLVEHGHRRIAFLNGPPGLTFSTKREDGFLSVLKRHGIAPVASLMLHDNMTQSYGYAAATRLLAQKEPPTAVIAASILVAAGVLRAIHEAGLRVGRDVSLVAHDDVLSYLPNDGSPPLYTVTRSSVRDAGARLADIVIDQIENRTLPPRGEMLYADLVIGQSSGPAPELFR